MTLVLPISEKLCSKCGQVKSLTCFSKNRSGKDGLQHRCKPCHREAVLKCYYKNPAAKIKKAIEWEKANKEKYRVYHYTSRLKTKFGKTYAWYIEALTKQGGVCKICLADEPGRKNRFFCVDHCHATGVIRGILCAKCNDGLGKLGDGNTAVLESAIEYLSKPIVDAESLVESTIGVKFAGHRTFNAWKCGLKRNYRMTPGKYLTLLEIQQGCCAICRTDTPVGDDCVFSVDHDHLTDQIRGLLCMRCNDGLGKIADSVQWLKGAIRYLSEAVPLGVVP